MKKALYFQLTSSNHPLPDNWCHPILLLLFFFCDNYSMINTINSNYRISNQISITTIKIIAWSNYGSTLSLLIWYLSKHKDDLHHSIISCNDYSINNHILDHSFSPRSRLKLPLDCTNSLLIWSITETTHRWREPIGKKVARFVATADITVLW